MTRINKSIPNFEIKVTKINPKIIGGVVKFPYIVGDIQIWPYNHSLKFFETYKDEFISNLVLPEAPEVSDERIAFHIRLGDYVNLSYRFGSVVKYFHHMFEKFGNVFQIDVYSDSPEVVKNIYSAYEFNIKICKFCWEQFNLFVVGIYFGGEKKYYILSRRLDHSQ